MFNPMFTYKKTTIFIMVGTSITTTYYLYQIQNKLNRIIKHLEKL